MAKRLAVHVLTYDSLSFLAPCLAGIREQTRCPDRVLFIDCASADGTTEWLQRERETRGDFELLLLDENRGYAGGHNAGLAAHDDEFVLLLNPDVRLDPCFLENAMMVMERHPEAGTVGGRLYRADATLGRLAGPVLDSTGLEMSRTQRHRDRGAGQVDTGQYNDEQQIFGASGAAPLYRRAMLVDTAIRGEVFDETFFLYREDVDLAWRARLLGWTAWYAPQATAAHRRRCRPGTRRSLPTEINRHAVKNRFLLRLKNQTWSNLCHTWPGLGVDLLLVGWVLTVERTSIPGLRQAVAARRDAWNKRRSIMTRRRVPGWEVDRWFGSVPADTVAPPRA